MSRRPDDSVAPTQWALRKEAKRNMYLTSTDQVRVQRRGGASASATNAQCQKCLRTGHWTYECKNDAVYVARTSRSQQLKNPKLRQSFNEDKPPEDAEKEAAAQKSLKKRVKSDKKETIEMKTKRRLRHKKRRARSDSDSSSDSSSESESESDSSTSSSSSSSSSSESDTSSDSDHSARRRHRTKRRRKD